MIYFVDCAGENLLTRDRMFQPISSLSAIDLKDALLTAADAKMAILTSVRLALDECYVFPVSDWGLLQYVSLPKPVVKSLRDELDKESGKDDEA